jgi:hypothetical protein
MSGSSSFVILGILAFVFGAALQKQKPDIGAIHGAPQRPENDNEGIRTQQAARDKLQAWIDGKPGAMDWVDTLDPVVIHALITGDVLTAQQKQALMILRASRAAAKGNS